MDTIATYARVSWLQALGESLLIFGETASNKHGDAVNTVLLYDTVNNNLSPGGRGNFTYRIAGQILLLKIL